MIIVCLIFAVLVATSIRFLFVVGKFLGEERALFYISFFTFVFVALAVSIVLLIG